MKTLMSIMLALSIAICFSNIPVSAAEHGGKEHGGSEQAAKEHGGTSTEKEHGGKERGGTETSAPSAEEIRAAMKEYVESESAKTGSLQVYDPEIEQTRNLKLIRVHERVGKTGDYYYSCADFDDIDSGEKLDLDLDVEDKGGKLSVVDVRIHKVNGKERYTHDENDNRIPLSN